MSNQQFPTYPSTVSANIEYNVVSLMTSTLPFLPQPVSNKPITPKLPLNYLPLYHPPRPIKECRLNLKPFVLSVSLLQLL